MLRLLPERAALGVGAGLGRAAGAASPRLRGIADANLRLAFPEWSGAERRGVRRRHFAELGRAFAEWARLADAREEELLARVTWSGIEHLEKARAEGRGVLLLTAHCGSWELLPLALRARFPQLGTAAVGRVLADPALRRRVEARRRRGGAVLPQSRAAVLDALREGAAVFVLADHCRRPRHGGILAPFLGVRAWSDPGPARLARRSGAPVVPLHIRRLPDGRHAIAFGPRLAPPAGPGPDADAEFTARASACAEACVRAAPEQWLWTHRRFLHAPDAPADLYPPRRRPA